MTDEQLEQRLRDWYRSEIPADETAPAALRSGRPQHPAGICRILASIAPRRGVTLLAAAALVGLLAGSVGVGAFLRQGPSPRVAPVWTATGRMISGHEVHTATLLSDGKVLVAGRYQADQQASAELYDPGTESWAATGRMIDGRVEYTATLLADGTVLVAGGFNGNDSAAAELYDPSTGSWTATGSMTEGRSEHTSTLLPNGMVLVAGGAGEGGVENGACARLR